MSLGKIDHIVVLMLENRSFDSMLGKLYPKSATFDGLDGTEQNPDSTGVPVQVWSSTGTDENTMRIPDPDPGELWTDIDTQLFGMPNVGSPAPIPTMDGFVKNYVNQPASAGQTFDPKNVMHYFTPKQVPVISRLLGSLRCATAGSLPLLVRRGRTVGLSMPQPPTATKTTGRYIYPTLRQYITASSKRASETGRSISTTSRRLIRC